MSPERRNKADELWDLATRLKRYRITTGLTWRQLATRWGISYSKLCNAGYGVGANDDTRAQVEALLLRGGAATSGVSTSGDGSSRGLEN